jgi:exosortase/archaeosortase family protein
MKRRSSVRFPVRVKGGLALRLAVCGAVIAVLFWAASAGRVTTSIQAGFAHVVGGVLTAFGEAPTVVGNIVQTERFGISVVTACTGLFLTGLFVAAVVLLPTRWLAKWIGFGLGIGGISLLNVLRLVSLYYVGVHWPDALDTVHLLVWQSLLIVSAVILWLVWARVWGRAPAREGTS